MDTKLDVACPFEEGAVYVYGATSKIGCTAVCEGMEHDGITIFDMGATRCELDPEFGPYQVIVVYSIWAEIPKHLMRCAGKHNIVFLNINNQFYSDEYWALVQNNTELLNELMNLLPPVNPVRVKREELITGAENARTKNRTVGNVEIITPDPQAPE